MTPINCISFWFPPLQAAGLPVPRTTILIGPCDLMNWLDGEPVEGGDRFLRSLLYAVVDHQGGPGNDEEPVFLRTGHTSAKHHWDATCHLTKLRDLEFMVGQLIEESAMGIPGLPTDVWAVRSMIQTRPLFRCLSWKNFPVTREFRLFVRDGEVVHLQAYWPHEAVAAGHPDVTDWADVLTEASLLKDHHEYARLSDLAIRAGAAIKKYTGHDGYWSVDLLQDRWGEWWVTDMADGDRSYLWGVKAKV